MYHCLFIITIIIIIAIVKCFIIYCQLYIKLYVSFIEANEYCTYLCACGGRRNIFCNHPPIWKYERNDKQIVSWLYTSVTCDCDWKDFYAFRKDNNYNNKKKVWAFLYDIVWNSYFSWDNAKLDICIFQYLPVLEIAENILSLVQRIFLLRVVIWVKVINSSRNRGRFTLENSALSIYLRYYTRKCDE